MKKEKITKPILTLKFASIKQTRLTESYSLYSPHESLILRR